MNAEKEAKRFFFVFCFFYELGPLGYLLEDEGLLLVLHQSVQLAAGQRPRHLTRSHHGQEDLDKEDRGPDDERSANETHTHARTRPITLRQRGCEWRHGG